MSITEEYQRILNENWIEKNIEQPAVVEAGTWNSKDKENFNLIVVRPTSPVLTINKEATYMKQITWSAGKI